MVSEHKNIASKYRLESANENLQQASTFRQKEVLTRYSIQKGHNAYFEVVDKFEPLGANTIEVITR